MLTTQYENFCMKECETIFEMNSRFTSITNELRCLGEPIPVSKQVRKILKVLPKSWESKVDAIIEAKDLMTLPMDELIGNLQTYELNKKQGTTVKEWKKEKSVALKTSQNDVTEEEDEMAYVTKIFQKNINKHGVSKRKLRPAELLLQIINVVNESSELEEYTESHEDVSMMAIKDDENVFNSIFSLMAKSDDEEDLNERGSSQCWYMDSGCSRHMTGNTLNFLSLEAHQGGGVSFGVGKKGFILGISKIGRTADHSIDNVHYVDGLKFNLLSVSQICDKGNEVKFMSEGCVVTNCATKKIVMSAKRVKNMYVADLDSIDGDNLSCLSAQTDDVNL
ncbi:uncharacterized protein [Solanum tuberosum]|uniref:uncharacterized protein n=1 Tax=Solanum tuberosum TaxID=4113 RepID=UPI00073A23B1|nr:PREDICTED: uncharacterized protein LOC107058236 [Solanum tuberosum]